MRPIRNSAFGVGIASGIAVYVLIRFYRQMAQPGLVLELLAALAIGLGLAAGYYLFCKRTLRRVAHHFRAVAAPLVGAALPPMRADELEELRQTFDRAVKALVRHDRYGAIADQLRSSSDITSTFRVIAEHAARALLADGAVLFVREGGLLRPAAADQGFHLPATDLPSWRSGPRAGGLPACRSAA
jgi:hypothetical protein